MKCYHCHNNEAEYRFFVSFQGNTGEVRLCPECLAELQEYALNMFRDLRRDWVELIEQIDIPIGVPQSEKTVNFSTPRDIADRWDPGDALIKRRQINELKARLEAALAEENYELAIKLRDEINDREKGVHIYGT